MKKAVPFSIFIILFILVFLISGNCSKTLPEYGLNKTKSNEKENPIEKDIIRIQNLYKLFNAISRKCVSDNNISKKDIKKLNFLINKINYYQEAYSIKYSCLFNSNKFKKSILSSEELNNLISDYIFYTNSLRKLDGCQFVNL